MQYVPRQSLGTSNPLVSLLVTAGVMIKAQSATGRSAHPTFVTVIDYSLLLPCLCHIEVEKSIDQHRVGRDFDAFLIARTFHV